MKRTNRSRLSGCALALLWGFMPLAVAESLAPVPEPTDYRMDNYRAPVPATLHGAHVVTVSGAMELWSKKTVLFLDVMPRLPKPDKLPQGTIWRDKPRDNIPGSYWLDNVGYGALSKNGQTYFKQSLSTLTHDNKEQPLLFYCMANCWMSWNAAKRALSWGYKTVYWLPAGADGWAQAGLTLETAQPYRGH